jgi:hypothetical protein
MLRSYWIPLSGLTKGEREVLYQTWAGVTGALLGFGVVAVTILFTVTPKTRLLTVMSSGGDQLQALVTNCLAGLAIATIGFAVMIAGDSGKLPGRSSWLFVALAIFSVLRFGRLWWLLGRALRALALDSINTATS